MSFEPFHGMDDCDLNDVAAGSCTGGNILKLKMDVMDDDADDEDGGDGDDKDSFGSSEVGTGIIISYKIITVSDEDTLVLHSSFFQSSFSISILILFYARYPPDALNTLNQQFLILKNSF